MWETPGKPMFCFFPWKMASWSHHTEGSFTPDVFKRRWFPRAFDMARLEFRVSCIKHFYPPGNDHVSHQWKRKLLFPATFKVGYLLVPWRVILGKVSTKKKWESQAAKSIPGRKFLLDPYYQVSSRRGHPPVHSSSCGFKGATYTSVPGDACFGIRDHHKLQTANCLTPVVNRQCCPKKTEQLH